MALRRTKTSGAALDPLCCPELEELAEGLELALKQEGLVRGQSLGRRKGTFRGSDAVTAIQQLLQAKCGEGIPAVSREEALRKGLQMQSVFRFFRHASNKDKPLTDKPSEMFQFDCNLPNQVKKSKSQYKSCWDKARLIEEHVECKDRRQLIRVFRNCFIAREAVDTIMELKLVRSRKEAVHLMRKLNQKVFLCEHVCHEHEFKDENLLFEFIPHNERMREPCEIRAFCRRELTKDPSKPKSRRRLDELKSRLLAANAGSDMVLTPRAGGPVECTPTSAQANEMSWSRLSIMNRAA